MNLDRLERSVRAVIRARLAKGEAVPASYVVQRVTERHPQVNADDVRSAVAYVFRTWARPMGVRG